MKQFFQKNFGYKMSKMCDVITKYLAMLDSMKGSSNITNVSYQIHQYSVMLVFLSHK